MLGDISFSQCLVDLIHFVHYTSHRGRLVNCDGVPAISREGRRPSVTKYEKAMLVIAIIAIVIDLLTFLIK